TPPAEESRPQEGAEDSRRPDIGAQEEQAGAGGVRNIQREPQPGVRGVDHRGQTGGDPRPTAGDHAGMAHGGKATELEVPAKEAEEIVRSLRALTALVTASQFALEAIPLPPLLRLDL